MWYTALQLGSLYSSCRPGSESWPEELFFFLLKWQKCFWLSEIHQVINSDCKKAKVVEKKMATHSSTLAWKIPWTEEPGGLQPMGSQRVGHEWASSWSFWGEEMVPENLRCSPKAPELLMAEPELWQRTPSCQASWSWPLTRCPCRKLESKVCPRASLVAQWEGIQLPV